ESRRRLRASFHQGITLQPRELAVNQADAQFLKRALAVIEKNLSDFEFDVDALAQNVAVSRRQLFRKLKAVTDMTPKAFIRSVRLKRAAQLLLESEMTVTEITFAVGFLDVKHFRTLFKERFGALPSEYVATSGEQLLKPH
ncbi:MAG: ATP-binding region ATPase domain protein, partial [Pedosphaera sp.]|nr:ATP-binding region ATPase domain protein [Pedosphaera sp.]